MVTFAGKQHPVWTFDRVVAFANHSDDTFEHIGRRTQDMVLWCPVLVNVLWYIQSINVYKGPESAINMISSNKPVKTLSQMLEEIYAEDNTAFLDMSTEKARLSRRHSVQRC